MPIYDIFLDITEQHLNILECFLKIFVILLVVHILYSYSSSPIVGIFGINSTELLNNSFLEFILYITIGILFYYLIFEEVVQFHSNKE